MSETALRDLNTLTSSDRKNESSSKGSFTKPFVGSANENVDVSFVSTHVNGSEPVNATVEISNSEVEYIESVNLSDVDDLDTSLKVREFVFIQCTFIGHAFDIYTLRVVILGDQPLVTRSSILFHVSDTFSWTGF